MTRVAECNDRQNGSKRDHAAERGTAEALGLNEPAQQEEQDGDEQDAPLERSSEALKTEAERARVGRSELFVTSQLRRQPKRNFALSFFAPRPLAAS